MTENHRGPADFTLAQLTQLLAPLNPNRIATLTKSGSKLSYLEAWDIRAALNRVFGFANWSADLTESELIQLVEFKNATTGKTQWRCVARCTMRLTIHASGATYTETAIAQQTGAQPGDVADFAIKTAESDALKRAAMNLGTTFGLSLYNKGATADVVKTVRDPLQSATLKGERTPVPWEEKRKAEARDLQPDEVQTVVGGELLDAAEAENPDAARAQQDRDAETPPVDGWGGGDADALIPPSDGARSAVAGAFARGKR